MIFYEPDKRDRALLPHDPFKALVAPRPIGWISTLGADGSVNLAPYSFFNAIGEGPPMLAFSSSGAKDSATFAGEGAEFVWNLVTWELREAMNETSAPLPRGEQRVRARRAWRWRRRGSSRHRGWPPPGARWSAASCIRLSSTTSTGRPANQFLVVGQVVGVHLDETAIVDEVVDTAALEPVARLGGPADYAVIARDLPHESSDGLNVDAHGFAGIQPRRPPPRGSIVHRQKGNGHEPAPTRR